MRPQTRLKYNSYLTRLASLNGVADATQQFTATPSVQQKLIDKQQESVDFLKKINFIPVTEMSAEIIGLSVTSTIAGRTATVNPGTPRIGRDPTGLDNRLYTCKKTDFDTVISYDKLDLWAKFPDFQVRCANMVIEAQARDRIMIGWNGTSAAATTDRNANTLLQDVNYGWLYHMRNDNAARVLSDGADTTVGYTTKLTYGSAATADYVDLDALAWDLRESLLPVWTKDDPNLVCIIGNDLLKDKYFGLVNSDLDPMNKRARDELLATKTLGGLKPEVVPFFPDGTILITSLANLSIYQQEGGNRRYVADEPKYNQIADYQSSNDAYVIENLELACMAENIARHDG